MSKLAEGIVGKATLFKGVVRTVPIEIVLVNEDGKPIANARCQITFANAQSIEVVSDSKGVIKFYRKALGKFEIKLL
jgi:uncharacterized GH25 family protein